MTAAGGNDAPTVVDAFVAGDEAALAEIYNRWSPLVYSVALRSLGNVPDAEDLTQQVFARAWGSREVLGHTRTKLPAWLIDITRNELAGAHAARSEPARVRTQGTTLTRGCDEIEPAELADRLVLADEISRLADVPQQVVRLALSEDLTHAQIAERLTLPASLVQSHLGDSLLTLRARLAVLHDAH